MKKYLFAALVAGIVLMTGCGGDNESSAAGTSEAAPTNEAVQTAEAEEKTAEVAEKTAEATEKTAEADTDTVEVTVQTTEAEPIPTEEAEQTTAAVTDEDTPLEKDNMESAETEELAITTEEADDSTDAGTGSIDLSTMMATCEETDGNIVITLPVDGFSMSMVYVFDENKKLIDTKSILIPGTVTSLEEMYAAADATVDMSEFVYEDGVYTANTGTQGLEGTSYDETLASAQMTVEFYNALMAWGSGMQEENADVSYDEYTVEAYIGTGYDYITEVTDDGFSMTSVEVPAMLVDVSIRTDVEFDELVEPDVTIAIMGETAEVTSNGTMKSGDVATWSYQYILAEGETVETVTVTVDGTAYDVTVE